MDKVFLVDNKKFDSPDYDFTNYFSGSYVHEVYAKTLFNPIKKGYAGRPEINNLIPVYNLDDNKQNRRPSPISFIENIGEKQFEVKIKGKNKKMKTAFAWKGDKYYLVRIRNEQEIHEAKVKLAEITGEPITQEQTAAAPRRTGYRGQAPQQIFNTGR